MHGAAAKRFILSEIAMRGLLFIFIAVPILEMLLLFKVSEYIGAMSTVALVLLTAVIGIQVLKRQGLSTFTRANEKINSGELPAQEMVEGLFLAVGGAFLLTPGFITDTLGFLLLIGPSRRMLVRRMMKSGRLSMFSMGGIQRGFSYTSHTSGPGEKAGHDVYEGEFSRENPPESRLDRPE